MARKCADWKNKHLQAAEERRNGGGKGAAVGGGRRTNNTAFDQTYNSSVCDDLAKYVCVCVCERERERERIVFFGMCV